MKTETFQRWCRAFRRDARTWGAAFCAATILLHARGAHAAAVVDTLSGGPFQGNPNPYGYVDGDTTQIAQFHTPYGLALDSTGNFLFVADFGNNAVRRLNLSGNLTETFVTAGVNRPVALALDSQNNLYVLNQGNGANGTFQKFDRFKNLVSTPAVNLVNATAVALDGSANAYLILNGNAVVRIGTAGSNVVGTITTPGTYLRGIAMLDNGLIALSDSGNHGIWLLNPDDGTKSQLTGFLPAGDVFGPPGFARFNQPYQLAKAGGGLLLVADRGNQRVKLVDSTGTVTHFYGVSQADWFPGWSWPGWFDGDACDNGFGTCAEAREPVGITVAGDGSVYATEVFYHLIRKITGSGLTGPGTGGGSGTNIVITPPTLSPNAGYFPMGQLITVGSPNPNVFYTTDGSTPDTNSARVTMNGNTGTIRWSSSTTDLTQLRVRAFVGTNASVTVSGQPVGANYVGVPPGPNGSILAGIGSTVIVPVVANLRPNDTVRSYLFRVEITPVGGAPMISSQFRPLDIASNDFIQIATSAQGGTAAAISVQSYALGNTRGLDISALGTNSNVSFSKFAVVALLAVPIPGNALQGQTYSINVLNSSATSNGVQGAVAFPAGPAATVLVTNVPYTVGDSAFGGWYDAGEFGNHDLDNADVNNAFYAAAGLRLPYPFTDVYNAMDAFPEDDFGFVGGDGEIRFLDWELIRRRAVGLDTNNWIRAWSAGGDHTNASTRLVPGGSPDGGDDPITGAPWNRQARVGALPVGNAVAGNWVNVPVYVRTANGATLGGLQFRCIITPDNGGPGLSGGAVFLSAGAAPTFTQGFKPNELACGWQLGSLNFPSRSSNYLGTLRFTIPPGALPGHTYTVRFANADGAPSLTTQYKFESKQATVTVGAPAVPSTDITSDEWKVWFFGSLTAPDAGPNSDPDLDGVPNWAEYFAGTDPTDPASRLQFDPVRTQWIGGQRQVVLSWLSAPGKAYEVLTSNVPTGGSWSLLNSVSGTGTVLTVTDTNPPGPRFYRLRVLP